MSEDKYHFEEIESRHIGGEEKSKICTRERVLWIMLVICLIGAVIGVSVYFTKTDTDKSTKAENVDKQITTVLPATTIVSSTGRPSPIPEQSTVTIQQSRTTTIKPNMQELLKRIDCIPEAEGGVVQATKELCDHRRCVFSKSGEAGIPDCYFSTKQGYKLIKTENTGLGFKAYLEKVADGPFGADFNTALFELEMRGEDVIRFTFDDPVFSRYKVPLELNLPQTKPERTKYRIEVTNSNPFSFQIIRNSTGTVLWDTGVGGLVLSDQFLQISTNLPSNNVYGFGENLHDSFRHDLQFKSWPMFARDQSPSHWKYANLYGVHPFYTCLENDGNSHGVFLLNSNAMDYSFTPLPMLTYRTIGGIFDFYMFLGPEPEKVIKQYTGVIGRPFMPPYWALDFQICRYGYRNTSQIRDVVERTKAYNIPHDVQYADIDHFNTSMDFTVDMNNFGDLKNYFKELRANGMRTVIILDPGLDSNQTQYEPYDNLTALRGAVMWPENYKVVEADHDSTGALLGFISHSWPSGKAVFPDFFKHSTEDLWHRLIVKHHSVLPFDALWIDMNEPANFGTNLERPSQWPKDIPPWSLHCPINNHLEDPPYRTS